MGRENYPSKEKIGVTEHPRSLNPSKAICSNGTMYLPYGMLNA